MMFEKKSSKRALREEFQGRVFIGVSAFLSRRERAGHVGGREGKRCSKREENLHVDGRERQRQGTWSLHFQVAYTSSRNKNLVVDGGGRMKGDGERAHVALALIC